MHKKNLIITCIYIFCFCLVTKGFALEVNKNDYAVLGDKKIFLKIAGTPEERAKGLMYIKRLPGHQGMIFLFPNAEKRIFWMKNVNIPLDMIFIRKRKIMNIYKNIPIYSKNIYKSVYKADCVIEVNAGFCDKHNVNSGDYIYISDSIKSRWNLLKNSQQ